MVISDLHYDMTEHRLATRADGKISTDGGRGRSLCGHWLIATRQGD